MSRPLFVLTVFASLVCPKPARADLVVYTFSGTIDVAEGAGFPNAAGARFTGVLTYDTRAEPVSASPNTREFGAGAVVDLRFEVAGGGRFSKAGVLGAAPAGTQAVVGLSVEDDMLLDPETRADGFGVGVFWSAGGARQLLSFGLSARGSAAGTRINAVTSLNLADQRPDLDRFTFERAVRFCRQEPDGRYEYLRGEITSPEQRVVAVPEPSGTGPAALGGAAVLLTGWRCRRRGIATPG